MSGTRSSAESSEVRPAVAAASFFVASTKQPSFAAAVGRDGSWRHSSTAAAYSQLASSTVEPAPRRRR